MSLEKEIELVKSKLLEWLTKFEETTRQLNDLHCKYMSIGASKEYYKFIRDNKFNIDGDLVFVYDKYSGLNFIGNSESWGYSTEKIPWHMIHEESLEIIKNKQAEIEERVKNYNKEKVKAAKEVAKNIKENKELELKTAALKYLKSEEGKKLLKEYEVNRTFQTTQEIVEKWE